MKKILGFLFISLCIGCSGNAQEPTSPKIKKEEVMNNYPVIKSEEEWKEVLSDEQYRVLRQKGTEAPHTGKYNMHFGNGEYRCAGCNSLLFEGNSKFKSNCGWPSFDEAIQGSIEYVQDRSFGMLRTEVVCSNCGGHLGHVFDDGPTETGQRYCINSASIEYEEKQ